MLKWEDLLSVQSISNPGNQLATTLVIEYNCNPDPVQLQTLYKDYSSNLNASNARAFVNGMERLMTTFQKANAYMARTLFTNVIQHPDIQRVWKSLRIDEDMDKLNLNLTPRPSMTIQSALRPSMTIQSALRPSMTIQSALRPSMTTQAGPIQNVKQERSKIDLHNRFAEIDRNVQAKLEEANSGRGHLQASSFQQEGRGMQERAWGMNEEFWNPRTATGRQEWREQDMGHQEEVKDMVEDSGTRFVQDEPQEHERGETGHVKDDEDPYGLSEFMQPSTGTRDIQLETETFQASMASILGALEEQSNSNTHAFMSMVQVEQTAELDAVKNLMTAVNTMITGHPVSDQHKNEVKQNMIALIKKIKNVNANIVSSWSEQESHVQASLAVVPQTVNDFVRTIRSSKPMVHVKSTPIILDPGLLKDFEEEVAGTIKTGGHEGGSGVIKPDAKDKEAKPVDTTLVRDLDTEDKETHDPEKNPKKRAQKVQTGSAKRPKTQKGSSVPAHEAAPDTKGKQAPDPVTQGKPNPDPVTKGKPDPAPAPVVPDPKKAMVPDDVDF